MSDDEEEIARYREQQDAWAAERARRAARPWWRKLSDGVSDFSERYRWAIGLTTAAFAIAFGVAAIVLFVAWLTH